MAGPLHTNALAGETSPYLLQHAHNPVNWIPWGKEALDKARSEGKLIIVSIGYSSCHWCHVMEQESFEDTAVASLMNEHFVSIKVDREERPDIDHIYMTAVQLISQQGGWPLNCIALPDGRPIWGGTYFPREQWMEVLNQVYSYYRENPGKTEQYAADLAEGITRNSLFQDISSKGPAIELDLEWIVKNWLPRFDLEQGGSQGAPKFPMPVNLEFLLQYGIQHKNQEVLQFVDLTLTKMARGGIYDQVGGGFARYSVDQIWKVPHFEKMLYDNAQLVGLYAQAYQVFGRETYRQVVVGSIEFLKREMVSQEGAFYSALDADSEGEEGKFYIWSRKELEGLLEGDLDLFAAYYNILSEEMWQNNRYILFRNTDPEDFAADRGLDLNTFRQTVARWNSLLLEARNGRIRPGLDDKSVTSWNALMISGLVKATRALGDPSFLEMALKCAKWISEKMWSPDKILYRSYKNGRHSIPGFLPDYAMTIEAFLELYGSSMNEDWLKLAAELTQVTMDRFFDEGSGMFFYNAADTEVLITHQTEIQDSVIPSSNSVMARNLFTVGHFLSKKEYHEIALSMLGQISALIEKYPNGYAGWGGLLLKYQNPFYEIAVVGPGAPHILKQLSEEYLPQALLAATTSESDLPLFNGRYRKDRTCIFVCRDNVCQLPLEDPEHAKAIYHQ
jgi:uncharacterized protein YyaL (SSP411 family)